MIRKNFRKGRISADRISQSWTQEISHVIVQTHLPFTLLYMQNCYTVFTPDVHLYKQGLEQTPLLFPLFPV